MYIKIFAVPVKIHKYSSICVAILSFIRKSSLMDIIVQTIQDCFRNLIDKITRQKKWEICFISRECRALRTPFHPDKIVNDILLHGHVS